MYTGVMFESSVMHMPAWVPVLHVSGDMLVSPRVLAKLRPQSWEHVEGCALAPGPPWPGGPLAWASEACVASQATQSS